MMFFVYPLNVLHRNEHSKNAGNFFFLNEANSGIETIDTPCHVNVNIKRGFISVDS